MSGSTDSPVLDGELGACHFLEVPFVFDRLGWPPLLGDSPPPSLASEMHASWVRFATTGSPADEGLSSWPRYTVDRRTVMVFDSTIGAVDDPAADERELWDGLW